MLEHASDTVRIPENLNDIRRAAGIGKFHLDYGPAAAVKKLHEIVIPKFPRVIVEAVLVKRLTNQPDDLRTGLVQRAAAKRHAAGACPDG